MICIFKLFIILIILFYIKKDLEISCGCLIKLIVTNPNHIGGLQQLARVRVDLVMACTDRDQGTGHSKQALKGAMDCYERAISIINDVRNLLMTSLASVS
jgi:hypothetical protein